MGIITYKVVLSPDVVAHTCNTWEAKAGGLPWVQRVTVSSRPTWVTDKDPTLKQNQTLIQISHYVYSLLHNIDNNALPQ